MSLIAGRRLMGVGFMCKLTGPLAVTKTYRTDGSYEKRARILALDNITVFKGLLRTKWCNKSVLLHGKLDCTMMYQHRTEKCHVAN